MSSEQRRRPALEAKASQRGVDTARKWLISDPERSPTGEPAVLPETLQSPLPPLTGTTTAVLRTGNANHGDMQALRGCTAQRDRREHDV
jgi:hypothetical protein